ncbi:hypothetical protein [Streptomyces capillispiralis]|uniref:hypothetical protein n=1 Tax=Streptomyces capillispiralis TaxID=68182 RepID=UPI00119E903B|nr:hypothetical protein [Streptomyces capillispiralis]
MSFPSDPLLAIYNASLPKLNQKRAESCAKLVASIQERNAKFLEEQARKDPEWRARVDKTKASDGMFTVLDLAIVEVISTAVSKLKGKEKQDYIKHHLAYESFHGETDVEFFSDTGFFDADRSRFKRNADEVFRGAAEYTQLSEDLIRAEHKKFAQEVHNLARELIIHLEPDLPRDVLPSSNFKRRAHTSLADAARARGTVPASTAPASPQVGAAVPGNVQAPNSGRSAIAP